MKVSLKKRGNKLFFYFEQEEDDKLVDSNIDHRMGNNTCFVEVPSSFDLNKINPDILHLAAVLIIEPYSRSRIVVEKPISKKFQDYFYFSTGKHITSIQKHKQNKTKYLLQNSQTKPSVPALCFSGGVDSTAALAIMPKNTKVFFLDRKIQGKTKYNKTAAYESCRILKKRGVDVNIISTDLEYVRNPVGFSTPLAVTVPVLLWSDKHNIDTIALGNILEAMYGIDKQNKFNDSSSSPFRCFDELFKYVDLPLSHVCAGLSEAATTFIVHKSTYNNVAQSCMRGNGLRQPCMNCMKCFRKTLYKKQLKREPIKKDEDLKLLSIDAVVREFTKKELTLHNAYMYIFSRIQQKTILVLLVKLKLGGRRKHTEWMNYWYYPARELISPKYRTKLENEITAFIPPASKKIRRNIEGWRADSYCSTRTRSLFHFLYTRLFNNRLKSLKK